MIALFLHDAISHALSLKKLLELILERSRNDFLDAGFVIHQKIGAGDHDAKSRTEKSDEERDPADSGALDSDPFLFHHMRKPRDFSKGRHMKKSKEKKKGSPPGGPAESPIVRAQTRRLRARR